MSIKDHFKANTTLAVPVMLSMLGQVMTGVADSIMVGWTGATPLAASSFANVFFTIPLFFGVGVSYAITPLVAEADGGGDRSRVIDVLKNGTFINLATGLLLVVLIFAIEPLLTHLNQPAEVVSLALPYLSIVALSILPTMVFQTYRQFAEGLHDTRMAMIVVIGSNLLNVLLNYLLIFGRFGFPALGLNGAGWATLISRVVMGLSMFLYVYYAPKFHAYKGGFSITGYSKKLINQMLHIGIPAGSQFIFEAGAFGLSAIMMGWFGTTALAAHQIAINLATISYMTTSGLASAATIRVGHFLGKKNRKQLTDAAYTLIIMALGLMVAWAVLFIAGRYLLPTLYIRDADVITLTASLLVIAGFFQLSDGMQVVCAGALRGLQDVKIPSLLIFVAYWIIALPLGYYLAFTLELGPSGIWYGLLIGLTLVAGALFVRLRGLMQKV